MTAPNTPDTPDVPADAVPGLGRRAWRRPLAELVRERRGLAVTLAWSLAATLPALLSGQLVARSLDHGFLRDDLAAGLGWLAVLGAAMVVAAASARRVPPALGRVVEPLRDRLVRRVVTGTLRRAVGAGPGRPGMSVITRMSEHTETVRDTTAGLLLGMQQVGLTVTAAAVGLALLAPVVALLVVPPVVLTLLLLVRLLPELAARERTSLLAEERVADTVSGVVSGVRDVVACGAAAEAAGEAAGVFRAQAAAERAAARASALRTALGTAGGHLSLVMVLAAGPWLLHGGGLTTGELLGALTYVTANLQPALRAAVQTAGGAAVRLGVTLHRLESCAGPEPESRPDAAPASGTGVPDGCELRVDRLTFAYGTGAEPVLRDVTFAVPYGSHLAVVGPSGIGKSTLADLLTGVAEPARGTVSIGGLPLGAVDPGWLRRTIAIIPQEAYVFAGSLRENLAYLRPAATEAEIEDAVTALGLGPLRDRLGGAEAAIGSSSGLTPGERQMIALARVWLSPARIVLLDEATCHLDPVTEARMEEAFRARPGTLVVIAHRLSSARRADRVLVMDGERTVLGRHDELPRRSGLYADLVGAWQAGRQEDERRDGARVDQPH
ncbi:ABC transporter ATP-binding protein [Actinomadura sp. WMMB 499]|uniref:ATP-binding cassette domain-containing protein n=1 Tax=Actinomadura sp. WMMB 499 TaxID=1219491 RepID=UPI001245BBD8|nr:ABC transporter ATP-binding protein [Actinomadura sp. WMMB 499]QFG21357.1 ABC transporter ATP-binding protein [Actinomadura sp. WMMB 499]